MFENIIGYETLTQHLSELIITRELPSAILLSGTSLSGKQTIATEISRTILCDQEGKWNCTCNQCIQSRMLNHQNVLFLGRTSVQNEILCGKTMLLTDKTERDRLFFCRAVAKMLRKADSLLWESSDYWNRTLRAPAESLSELIQAYREDNKNWYSEKVLDKICIQTEKLNNAFPQQMLPVQCIRNVIAWCQVRSHAQQKIIIMNHVEEMLAASANMLLKILEEPPEDVYFILLTENSQSVLPTIRSRTREFALRPRTKAIEKRVLEKIFRYQVGDHEEVIENTTAVTRIHQYLDSFSLLDTSNNQNASAIEKNNIQKQATHFFQAVLRQQGFSEELIQIETDGVKKTSKISRQHVLLFISYLTTCVIQLLDDEAIFSHFVKIMWTSCEQARENIQRRNMSALLVLEILYYTLSKDYELFNTYTRRIR